jgi:predicted permease
LLFFKVLNFRLRKQENAYLPESENFACNGKTGLSRPIRFTARGTSDTIRAMLSLFFLLLGKILPLYTIILCGYVAGRVLNVQRESIASLAIYFITPVVFFGATAQMHVEKEFLLLPPGVYLLSCVLGLGAYAVAGKIWPDIRKNLAGYMMGTANQGYFGVPVFTALFGGEHLGLYIFAGLGLSLYEATFGYYLMARGKSSVRDSLKKLARLPVIPAALAGIAFSALGFTLPDTLKDFYTLYRGAYTVLGMLLIGLGLGRLHHLARDPGFTAFTLAGRFIVWPLAGFLFLQTHAHVLGNVPEQVRQIVTLLSILPVAANAVAFATHLKMEPEKTAATVVISTFFALFYIPLAISLLLPR